MKKSDVIDFLNKEGWTKADAKRAIKSLRFKRNNSINEIIIRRAASKFAGAELDFRQKRQIARKALVNKQKKQINRYFQQIKKLQATSNLNSSRNFQTELTEVLRKLQQLEEQSQRLLQTNQELLEDKLILQQDNNDLRNIIEANERSLTQETARNNELRNIIATRELSFAQKNEQNRKLLNVNRKLLQVKRTLQKDNKNLQNITDAIKFRFDKNSTNIAEANEISNEQNRKLLNANQTLQKENRDLKNIAEAKKLSLAKETKKNKTLKQANETLEQENKDLKNITNAIKLKLTKGTMDLMRLENSEIKKGLMKLLNSVLG